MLAMPNPTLTRIVADATDVDTQLNFTPGWSIAVDWTVDSVEACR